MSWSEISGIYSELDGIKKVIRENLGISVHGGEVRDTDKEIDDIRNELKAYFEKNETLIKRIDMMSLDLNRLTEEVSRAQTVQTSAVALLKSLTEELAIVSADLKAKGEMVPPEVDVGPLNDLIDRLKDSTDVLAGAVADSTGVVQHKEVILNKDDPTAPTVSVVMPEVLPENVTVSAEKVVDTVDPASTEPQVVVTVEPAATAPVDAAAPVVSDVIPTDEGQVDVKVEAPADHVDEIKADTGVDIIESVKEAFDATPEVVAEPAPEVTPEVAVEAPAEAAPEVAVEAPAEVAPEAPVEAAPEVAVEAAPAEVAPEAAPEAPVEEPKV